VREDAPGNASSRPTKDPGTERPGHVERNENMQDPMVAQIVGHITTERIRKAEASRMARQVRRQPKRAPYEESARVTRTRPRWIVTAAARTLVP
jgi:hypothetical protein